MVKILVLSFLFKGESFSFVRGLWLLDLNNRKTFFVDIFLDLLCIWCSSMVIGKSIASYYLGNYGEIYIFRGNFVLSTGGRLHLGVFAGVPQHACLASLVSRGYH